MQKDIYNCSCFIMLYMDILTNNNFSEASQPDFDNYRTELATFLLKSSLPMEKICLYCDNTRKPLYYKCQTCYRWVHKNCKKYVFVANVCKMCISISNKNYNQVQLVGLQNPTEQNKNNQFQLVGLQNPTGQNRCWLNASLQVLLALPLFNELHKFEFPATLHKILTIYIELLRNIKCQNPELNVINKQIM